MDKQARPEPTAAAMDDKVSQAIATIAARSQQIVTAFLDRQKQDAGVTAIFDPFQLGAAFRQMTTQMLASPASLVEAQFSLWNDYMRLWQSTAQQIWGIQPEGEDQSEASPIADRSRLELFAFIKQSFLLTARWLQALSLGANSDSDMAQKLDFYTLQMIDAMDPQEFFRHNADLLRTIDVSHYETLVSGLDHLLGALESSKSLLQPFPAPTSAALGGSRIFANDMIELYHWPAPSPGKSPVLLLPPWTHGASLFDLTPESSLVRFLVAHGHPVYLLDWRDDRSERDLAAVLAMGPLAALAELRRRHPDTAIHAAGFDLGGTLLAACMALQAAQGGDRFASASFFGSLFDFRDHGEIAVFIGEESLRGDRNEPGQDRLLDDFLRANDLIWSYVLDCFEGELPDFPFALLHWIASKRTPPPALLRFYLQDLYQDNRLIGGEKLQLGDHRLDLRRITAPCYMLGMAEDHLAPWGSVVASSRHLGGEVRLVRAGRGHLRGLINPPPRSQQGFWASKPDQTDLAAWEKQAFYRPGSWWDDWQRWLILKS